MSSTSSSSSYGSGYIPDVSFDYGSGTSNIPDVSTPNILGNSGDYDTSGGGIYEQVQEKVRQMRQNSEKYHGASKDVKKKLDEDNVRIANEISSLIGRALVRGTDGVWYLDYVGGPKFYETYPFSTFHSGGVVGSSTLKQDEEFAKLQKGELVINEDQQKPMFEILDFADTLMAKYGTLFSKLSGNNLQYENLKESIMNDSKQTKDMTDGSSNMRIENHINVPVQVLQKLDEREISSLASTIGDATIKRINDSFYKRGKVKINRSLMP